MRGHIANYSQLLIEELRAGAQVHSTVSKLKKLLKRRRHETLLHAVLKKTEQTLMQERDHSIPVVIAASLKEVKEYAATVDKDEKPILQVDPSIIGGHIILKDFTITDQSYKSKLLNWYRLAIKN